MSDALQHLADRVADGHESAAVLAVLREQNDRLTVLETPAPTDPVADDDQEV